MIKHSGKLSGAYYENARDYLARELSLLGEQKLLCYEAGVLYSKVHDAYKKFEQTGRLADALCCARLRG